MKEGTSSTSLKRGKRLGKICLPVVVVTLGLTLGIKSVFGDCNDRGGCGDLD